MDNALTPTIIYAIHGGPKNKPTKELAMKRTLTQDMILRASAYALEIPDLDVDLPAATKALDNFHLALTAAINCLRQHGCAQLIARPCDIHDLRNDPTYKGKMECLFRDMLDTAQLPGEKIEIEVKIGEKSGLIVITLFT